MFGYLKIILLMGSLATIGGAYAYYQVTISKYETSIARLESNNKTLKDNNTTLQQTADSNAARVEELIKEQKVSQEQVQELTNRNQELYEEKKKYMRIFSDHNLTRLARAKPGLIESRINKATASVFREVEQGSKEIQNADK